MKYLIFIVSLIATAPVFGQNRLSELLTNSDWKLCNRDTFPHAGYGPTSQLHDFCVSKDSILILTYCYITFDYKIESANKDTIVLRAIQVMGHATGHRFVLAKAQSTSKNNPFTNPKYLSCSLNKTHIAINDSIGIQVQVLNNQFEELFLTEKSKFGLEQFILNNRYNDTHGDFFVFELSNGKFGVVSNSEEVIIPPIYKKVEIDYANLEVKNRRRYSIPILCTTMSNEKLREVYFY